jgi:hypothetical protein
MLRDHTTSVEYDLLSREDAALGSVGSPIYDRFGVTEYALGLKVYMSRLIRYNNWEHVVCKTIIRRLLSDTLVL